ncbi:NTP pyrophosphohydrolase [Candidatus Methanoperedens nitroreducens]|uniref:Bis(5'-nucleosyl)-tetraphosphatase [asymmetrical] n=1 Tax=Candidatus Methanoperedens nitratireducens TaxID=1392998 RepID=A0A062V8X3_9EURY|nr:NUDIX domain-containing protein [Candidatus Methanoperedens nitroreducens]KCZ72963.1 NTP pyrophosphohydrolase [Candidatus Methanoperedens nitroreducens]MDJ1423094.1 NUDIX domain-containing protein [Candidatus Methanoperedens sp.]
MPRKRSCGAVVFRRNQEVRYLLLRYEAGHWEFVKGEVEANEGEMDTVIRELKEETGITDARFIGDFREKISYFFKSGGKTIYKEVTFFLIETQESDVELSHEHTGYEWLNYKDAMERLTFNNAKNVLKKAHNFLKAHRIIESS